jgi:very-short-patch-repair endonuclease
MPFDEALAVADSALRSGRVTRDDLLVAIAAAPRIGRGQAEAVARAADGRAANPFESCLRAICLDIRGLNVEPQVQIGPHRVDLADRRRRIVIEAESRTWHAGPDEHNADIRRYTTLVREGWLVIRFSYDDVMHDPAYVAEALLDVLRLAPVRAA